MKRDIDVIIEQLAAAIPRIRIDQLKVMYPGADDDGLWYVNVADREEEVQLESTHGSCPFLIESDFSDERFHARSVEEAIEKVKRLYGLV